MLRVSASIVARSTLMCAVAVPVAFVLGLALAGCAQRPSTIDMDNPDLAGFVQLILPARIEVQRYLTKPVSFAGDGNSDGIEVIVAAYDSFGDFTKVAGTFTFELQVHKLSSGDRLGQQVAIWSVPVNTADAMKRFYDRYSRFYVFPLQLDQKKLEQGRYVLSVRLLSPNGERLADEYEFNNDAAPATATPRARPSKPASSKKPG